MSKRMRTLRGLLLAFAGTLLLAVTGTAGTQAEEIPVIESESEKETEKTPQTEPEKKTEPILKTWTVTYKVIPATVRKAAGDSVNWKGNPVTYTKEDAFRLRKPSLRGYVFEGWFDDASGLAASEARVTKGSRGNKRFYAKFRPVSYTIEFDANGLGEAPKSILCVYGKTYRLPKIKNSDFIGWNTKENGRGTAFKGGEKVGNLTASDNKTILLYADGLTGRNNIEKLFRYFKRKGYTKEAAAAIAGNLMWESGGGYTDIKLNAVELATGRGVGMVQWTDTKDSPRRTNFVRYCKAHGYGWPNENLQLQISFLEAELRGDYGKIWYFSPVMGYPVKYRASLQKFQACKDVARAVGIFCACFERPYFRHAGLNTRVLYARHVLENYR